MKWFKEKEFVCRCCGELPPFARENIEALVHEVVDSVREKLGKMYVDEFRSNIADPLRHEVLEPFAREVRY